MKASCAIISSTHRGDYGFCVQKKFIKEYEAKVGKHINNLECIKYKAYENI